MKGSEFKAIRSFNKLKLIDIAKELNFKSHRVILEIEKYDNVPIRFINALSTILKVDLTKEEIYKNMLIGIPDKYFKGRNRKQILKYNIFKFE